MRGSPRRSCQRIMLAFSTAHAFATHSHIFSYLIARIKLLAVVFNWAYSDYSYSDDRRYCFSLFDLRQNLERVCFPRVGIRRVFIII